MNRLTVVLVLLISMVLISGVAFARDASEVGETVLDTLQGDNGSCAMLFQPYVAKTFKDLVSLPLVGKSDLRAELSYQSSIDDLTSNNRVNLKVGLEF